MRRLMRPARALMAAFGIAFVAILASAAPAGAHGIGGLSPTNYETRVLAVSPDVRGVSVRSADLGTKLELENHSGREVVVLGYDGEPYLRVDERGTFENRRSPARYLNRTTTATTPVPDSADPEAPPEWRRTGDGLTLRWHDHRAHWMGADDPPIVQRDRNTGHLVQRWRVDLDVGGDAVRVTGDVRWVPGPSPWPWIGAGLGGALAFGFAGRTRRWGQALGAGTAILAVAVALHVVGRFGSSTSSSLSTLGASVFELAGLMLALATLGVLGRRGAFAAAPAALFTGVVLLVSGGLADIPELSHSAAATTLPGWLNRLAITLTIAAAVGVSVIAWTHLAPSRREARSLRTRSRDIRARGSRARSRNVPTASP
jgi:hypothetical protein